MNHLLILMGIVSIAFPAFWLSLYDYAYVTDEVIVNNSFFQLHEDTYSIDQCKGVILQYHKNGKEDGKDRIILVQIHIIGANGDQVKVGWGTPGKMLTVERLQEHGIQLIKPDMKEEGPRKTEAQYVLWTALREFLILMHPIMPFVTAEIWQALPGGAGSDAAVQLLPEARPGCLKPEAAARMEFVQEVIGMIRTIRAELNIAPSYRLTVLLRPSDAHQKDVLEANREVILTLARLGELIIDADGEAPKASASHVAQGCEVIVHLSGAVDFAAELARLEKELGKIDKELGGLNQKLANEGFVSRAPAEIVERERARVAELTDARVKLTALQQRFRDVM